MMFFATLAHATPFFFCDSLPDPPGIEQYRGFGSHTVGGAGKPVINVGQVTCPPTPPTQADLLAAINAANATAGATIVFPANQTIWVKPKVLANDPPLPPALTANNVTILGS